MTKEKSEILLFLNSESTVYLNLNQKSNLASTLRIIFEIAY